MMVIADNTINLIITGVGGQGNILMSRLLGSVFLKKMYHVNIMDDIGVSQRSGAVQSVIRISKKRGYGPIVPDRCGHIIVGLEPLETLRRLRKYGYPHTFAIVNFRPIFPVGVLLKRAKYPDYDELRQGIVELTRKAWFVDATSIALKIDSPVLTNVVMIGALFRTQLLPIELEDIEKEIKERFTPRFVKMNLKAFSEGTKALAP